MTGFTSTRDIRAEENSIYSARSYSYDENFGDDDSRTRIKFTRKFTQQYKSCCCILLSLSVTLLSACIVLYCGYHYIKIEPGEEIIYQGSFIIAYNDSYNHTSLDSGLSEHRAETAIYIDALEKAIQARPLIHLSLISLDMLAIDKLDDRSEANIFFELKFNPRLLFTQLENLVDVLKENLHVPNGIIDTSSLSLREIYSSSMMSSSSLTPNLPAYSHILDDNFANTLGKCVPAIQLPFCPPVYNNLTSYPNIFMHKNEQDVKEDLIIFRELIDGECFPRADEFLCQVLQPACTQEQQLSVDETLLPCQDFCKEFLGGCRHRFSEKLERALDCAKFPEYSQYGKNCRKQPNCNAATLKSNDPLGYRFCDGVIDCINLEDEFSCDYCSSNDLHCGIHKSCVTRTSYCNDIPDCPDGSDEKVCLSLWPNTTSEFHMKTALDSFHYKEGYLIYYREGTSALVCVDEHIDDSFLRKIGQSLCKNTSYEDVQQVQIKKIPREKLMSNSLYAELHEEWTLGMPLTVTDNCSSSHALYLSCSDSECGIQPTRVNTNNLDGLNKLATAGDWPWHAALFKNGVHSCDATLLSESWLITSISCFQGQNKAEWVARLGAVRLYGKSPWMQERHIVGMLKSPVEGSTLVLIKLSSPVIFSNFVRPVCLPFNSAPSEELVYCNALGWSETRSMLQRIEIKETHMDNCADMSIMIHNGLCATSAFDVEECNEEEMAGSPMVCLTSQQQKWVLVGVSNWRISCSPIGMQRPRLYDKVVSNVNWIRNILKQPF